MTHTTYRDAMRAAIARGACSGDPRVFLMGEDVGALRRLLRREQGPAGASSARNGSATRRCPSRRSSAPGSARRSAGMRPIVEIMTVNFSLLALDQIMNNAATLPPHVRRAARRAARDPHGHRRRAPARRPALAQPRGLVRPHPRAARSLAPATLEDARGMLGPALADPDPVLIFEHAGAVQRQGELRRGAGGGRHRARGGAAARARRHADHLRRQPAQGAGGRRASGRGRASRPRSSTCARCGRSTTRRSFASVRKTHRAVVVDEGWRSGEPRRPRSRRASMESGFYDLDAPVEPGVQRRGADPLREAPARRRRCRSPRASSPPRSRPWVGDRGQRTNAMWRSAKLHPIDGTSGPGAETSVSLAK